MPSRRLLERDPRAVGGPGRVLVVGGVAREPGLTGAVEVHDVDLRVSVAAADEDDLRAVRADRGKVVDHGVGRQASLVRAVGVHRVDLTGTGSVTLGLEGDPAVTAGESCLSRSCQGEKDPMAASDAPTGAGQRWRRIGRIESLLCRAWGSCPRPATTRHRPQPRKSRAGSSYESDIDARTTRTRMK